MITFLQVSASTFAQRITLSEKNATLSQVFDHISDQSGYDFVFTSSILKDARPVNISVTDKDFKEVLQEIFLRQPLSYEIKKKTVFISLKDKPSIFEEFITRFQAIDVTGKVIDEKSQPISGATIKLKDTKVMTTTNDQGLFVLRNVPEGSVIEIYSLGYKTKEVTAAKELGSISLEVTAGELEEVYINTGYQKTKINEQNGAVEYISSQMLNNQTGGNILARLDGVTSSLLFNVGKSNNNPQNTTNISIRGLSTINGPLDPLIVLDNFIYEGNIANINPNDIESITVLKDAAAASIWGARAGNGVIVINTKSGRFNQPLQVSFNANSVISSKPDLFKMPAMSSADYIEVEELLFNKVYFNSQISGSPITALTPAIDIFLKRRQGKISKEDSLTQINALKTGSTRQAYSDYFYRAGLLQQYNLGFRGGGSNNQYIFSAGYDRQDTENYAEFSKLNIRVANTYKPIKNLTLQTGILYTNSTTGSGRPAYNSLGIVGRHPNYLSFADENGNPLAVPIAYAKSYTDTAGNGRLLDWNYYPIEEYKQNTSSVKLQEFNANTGLNYKFTSFLNLDLKYQYQQQSQNTQSLSTLDSYSARNLINSYSQLNRTTGVVKYIVPLGGINNLGNSSIQSQTLRAQLNFEHSWNNHSLSAIAGAESRETNTNGSQNTLYGYNADPLSSSNVDFVNTYPNFITGNLESISNGANLSEVTNRFISLYSNLAYSFQRKYTLTASARRDGSNIFGASTNDKWQPLWSAGLGWELSRENFYTLKFLPFLKLTATYGKSGNVDLSRSAVSIAAYGTNAATNFRFARISSISNPSLSWEESTQFNIRADFSLNNQVLSGKIEYYRKKGDQLYGITTYDYTTWGRGNTIPRNVAAMKGNGLDFVLQTKEFGQTLKWNLNLLHSYNTSKTTEYYGNAATKLSSLLSSGSSISPVIGKPLYAISAYKWAGLSATGDPMGYLNGEPSTDYTAMRAEANDKGIDGNIQYIGSANPEHFGSLISNLTWKRFTASVNIGYKLSYFLKKPAFTSQSLISGNEEPDYASRWKNPGDEKITDIPAFNYPNNSDRDAFYSTAEINIIKGDHIRLRYINLNYRVFNPTTRKFLFSQLEVYTNLANIGILWRANQDKLDPDNLSNIPTSRTLAFGLRSNF